MYEVRDLHLHSPGVHRLVRCRQCGMIWLESDAGVAHDGQRWDAGAYAPHRVMDTVQSGASKMRQTLKAIALAERRGYPAPAASRWQKIAGVILARLLANRLDHVPRYLPDGRLLDAGSGAGQYVSAMQASGWRAIGLEPEMRVSQHVSRRLHTPLVAGRMEDSPFRDSILDVITLWHSLEHTTSPRQTLQQAQRLLRVRSAGTLFSDAGGTIMLETPNVESWQAQLFGRYWFHLDAPRHRFHFTPATLHAYLTKCGFRKVRSRHLPSSVGITGSLQSLVNRLTKRRGVAIRESRLAQVIVWPLAVLEAILGHGGCVQITASAIPCVVSDSGDSPTPAGDPITLSVVIVSWNCWPHLRRCLESLQPALAGLGAEVIVVDNASSDGTATHIREGFPQVRFMQMAANAGFATACNRGFEVSQGRYVWMLNPDTIFTETTAYDLVQALDIHPRAGVAGPRILNEDGTMDPRSARKFPSLLTELLEKCGLQRLSTRMTRLPLDEAGCQPIPLLSGAAMCVRRKAMEEIGGLDESFLLYGEDMDLCRRLSAAGWQILYCGDARLSHSGSGSSRQCPDETGILAILSMGIYLRTHHGSTHAGLYRVAMTLLSAAKIMLFAWGSGLAPSHGARQRHRAKVTLHRRLLRTLREEMRP